MKKANIITGCLLVYLAVMAYIGWPNFIGQGRYLEYAGILFGTLVIIFILRYVLIKKAKLRKKHQEEIKNYAHYSDNEKDEDK